MTTKYIVKAHIATNEWTPTNGWVEIAKIPNALELSDLEEVCDFLSNYIARADAISATDAETGAVLYYLEDEEA